MLYTDKRELSIFDPECIDKKKTIPSVRENNNLISAFLIFRQFVLFFGLCECFSGVFVFNSFSGSVVFYPVNFGHGVRNPLVTRITSYTSIRLFYRSLSGALFYLPKPFFPFFFSSGDTTSAWFCDYGRDKLHTVMHM